MSHYEAEWGNFTLPEDDYSRALDTFRLEVHRAKEVSFDAAQRFSAELTEHQRTDPEAYQATRDRFIDNLSRDARSVEGLEFADDVRAVLASCETTVTDAVGRRRHILPTTPELSDITWPDGDARAFDDETATVYFDDRSHTIRWEVEENNRAVEDALGHRMDRLFNDELQKTRWTPNTGGVMYYRDEYDDGARTTRGIGPIGHEFDAENAEDYLDSEGELVRGDIARSAHRDAVVAAADTYREVFRAAVSNGRVGKGVPAGGQFTVAAHADDDVTLL
ncbi:hypothetical protein [Aeromicrobium sp. CTD01-1L150]|uniref:hypothetical protein n=1 Tax=Aeromicrobium sp. CTD01-1L150 TaxID=3341830 RepID=UPI0035C0C4E5